MFFEVTNIRTNVQNDSSEFEGLLRKMMPKKPFMSQVICYINGNGEGKLCTMLSYIKELLSIVEIKNKKCHRCYKFRTPVELVTDKLIMSLDGLHTSNFPRQIYHLKCTILANDSVVLDVIFHN